MLVVHHEQDGCAYCPFSEVPALMAKLAHAPRKGDPCEAFAYHGFNGLEPEVVQQVAAWVFAK